jgi:large subunit ribosomal protein L25
MEIPEHIDLDVSGMAIGDTLRLSDLAPMEGVTYLDNPEETVLASVGLPIREVEPEPEELPEGEEPAEGEEVPEGEAAEGAGEGEAADAGSGSGESGTSES